MQKFEKNKEVDYLVPDLEGVLALLNKQKKRLIPEGGQALVRLQGNIEFL